MRAIALPMVLLMLTASLAGCTSGDPDEGGDFGIDTDTLNQMIEDNLQDFINNTTVTVNQEIHYYNNSSHNFDNTDNSVSHYNGTSSTSDSTMYMFTVSWDRENSLLGFNPYSDLITIGGENGTEQTTLLFSEYYNGNVIEFHYSCMDFLYFERYSDNSWANWLEDNYGYGPSGEANDVGYDIWWLHHYRNQNEIQEFCNIGEYTPTPREILFEIDLDIGQAVSFQVVPSYLDVDLNCDDGYGTGLGNGTITTYIGGQANCTVTGSTDGYWRIDYNDWLYNEDGSRYEEYNTYFYEWYVRYSLIAPANFAIYFTMHDVQVYELDN